MSFTLLHQIDSIQRKVDKELGEMPDLEPGTQEYKLKQYMVALLKKKIDELKQGSESLSQQWDVDGANPPEEIGDYETLRHLEDEIAPAYDSSQTTQVQDSQEDNNNAAADGAGDDDEDDVAVLTPQEKKALKAAQRPSLIIKNITSSVLRFDAMLDRRMSPPTKATELVFNQAITELFQELTAITNGRVVDYLKGHHWDHGDLTVTLEAFKKAERTNDSLRRAARMGDALQNVVDAGYIRDLARDVVYMIGQMKFAIWWNSHDGNGATGWKQDYKKRLVEGKSQQASKVILGGFGKATDGRNIALRLYQQFGASIILQPLFKVLPNGGGAIQANREWLKKLVVSYKGLFSDSKLQAILAEKYPDEADDDEELLEHHLGKCHKAAISVVAVIMEKAGGEELKKWAEKFFEDYEDHQELNVGNN